MVSCCGAGYSAGSPAMFKVVVASAFVLVSFVTCEARTVRTVALRECNVTMPCDFSVSQTQVKHNTTYNAKYNDTYNANHARRSSPVDQAEATHVAVSGLDM